MTATSTINAQAWRVLALREEMLLAQARLRASREAWEAANAELVKDVSQLTTQLTIEEKQLRWLAVKVFWDTGNKRPAPGVSIRESTDLEYSQTDALAWAKKHDLALALDKKAFEKIVDAMQDRPRFVCVIPVVTATIATDLAKALQDTAVDPTRFEPLAGDFKDAGGDAK